MSTAAFSASGKPRRSIALRVVGRPTGTATSLAADEAIRRIVNDRHCVQRRCAKPRLRADGVPAGPGGLPDAIRSIAPGIVLRFAFRAIVVAIVAIILARATYRIVMSDRSLCGVSGSIHVGDRPLAYGILEFHLKAPAAGSHRFSTVIHTDAEGGFHRGPAGGLPRGTYAVVVKQRSRDTADGRRSQAFVIPRDYASPSSTPLVIEIGNAAASLDLMILP